MKKSGCFLLLAFVLNSAAAFAGDLTLFGGMQREGKVTLGSGATSGQKFTFLPKNFGVIGLRAGIGKKVLGTESTFAYNSNFIDSQSKAIILSQDLVIQAPLPVVKPYITAGIGTIITKGSGITNIGTKFAVNYGGGLKLLLLGPLGGRLDIRGYTIPKIQGQSLNILEVSLGIVFGF